MTIEEGLGNGRIRNGDPKRMEGKLCVGFWAQQHGCTKKTVGKTRHSSRSEVPVNKDEQSGDMETTVLG